MKIKLTVLYVLSFFSLVFLVHELHDWAHVLVARALCGCWGTRAFDAWTPCLYCRASSRELVLSWVAGPLVNYIFIWTGWLFMDPQLELDRRCLGFSLVFAALPFPRLLGALAGGGDETTSLRLFFQHTDGSNAHQVTLAGLLLVGVLTLPALQRAFLSLPGGWLKGLVFPAFLLLPGLLDRWLVGHELNKLIVKDMLVEDRLPGTSLVVVAWLFLLLLLCLFTSRSLSTLFEHKDLAL